MPNKVPLIDLASDLGLTPGTLATRSVGNRLWKRLEARLKDLEPTKLVVLSFSDVDMMDASFADEVFGTLAVQRSRRTADFGPVLISDANSTCIDNLEMALKTRADREPKELSRLRNCVLPVQKRGGIILVGNFEDHVSQSFALLMQNKSLTARALSDELGLNLNAASTRLKTLSDLGLAFRTETRDAQGKQFVYNSLR